MDEETRAALDEIREAIRLGFAETNRRFDEVTRETNTRFEEVNGRFDQVDGRFDQVDGRFDQVDGRFERVNGRFDQVDGRFDRVNGRFVDVDRRFETVMGEIRQNGVLIEELRAQIQQVAEGQRANTEAIERLRAEMNERFRENEIVVGAAFRQIRHDIDELRDRR